MKHVLHNDTGLSISVFTLCLYMSYLIYFASCLFMLCCKGSFFICNEKLILDFKNLKLPKFMSTALAPFNASDCSTAT